MHLHVPTHTSPPRRASDRIIPGIDFTNDPLLQGRLFSYLDTQKSRLGTTNFHQIPINAPKCPFHNFQRDGMMQTLVPTGRANYEPNSLVEAGERSEGHTSELQALMRISYAVFRVKK